MQIARGGGHQADSSPTESLSRSAFLDVVDNSPSSNLVENVLNTVAEYVEPAASKTTEIFDALNRVVVGDPLVHEEKVSWKRLIKLPQ